MEEKTCTEDFRKHLCGVLRDLILELCKNRSFGIFYYRKWKRKKNTALNNTEKMTKSVLIFIYEPKNGTVYMVFIWKPEYLT